MKNDKSKFMNLSSCRDRLNNNIELNLIEKFFLVFFVLFTNGVFAQQKYNQSSANISGTIIDSISREPIEYATITLINQLDNKIINGTTSDSKGNFKLEDIANGKYKIQIYFIGYTSVIKNNIQISNSFKNINLGNIVLIERNTELKAVNITAEKSFIENKIDKMVYNVEKDISSQSGVATDVMKKIPQISVDIDGNVELQGKAGIKFLINGKPSTIFGNNIADVLQSIPASQIQSIEVITSPGAKYDAEGTAGIINIILKKSTAEGINGNVALSAGTRLENGSINLNVHHKNFSAHAYLSGNAQLSYGTHNSVNRISQDTISLISEKLIQEGSSDFYRNGYQTGLGFDWDINNKNSVSGSIGYNHFGINNKGSYNRQSLLFDKYGNKLFDEKDLVNTINKFSENSYDFNLTYKKSFKKEDQELEISANSSLSNNNSFYDQTQKALLTNAILKASYGNDPGEENETEFNINYVQPISENVKIETGAKAIFTEIKSNSDVFLLNQLSNNYDYNTSQSSTLDYKNTIFASYVSASFKLLKLFDIKTGLRYEHTSIDARFSNSSDVKILPYSTYVPSIVMMYKFQNNQSIKLSYSHRIERPDYRDLNPYINASDPKNLSTGNKDLKPETGDKIELEYNKTYSNGTSLNTTLFFRGNKDDIQSYTRYYPVYMIGDSNYYNVSVSSRENVGRENNIGFNLYISVPATSNFNLRSNLSIYERYIYNGVLAGDDIHGINYRINLNASYQITETLIMEIFGNFNSPRINTQGKMPSFTSYNFAIRKQFFNKKASIAFTTTNPFNQYISQKTELTGTNFVSYFIRDLPYRSFGVNFTYKFGKLEFKKENDVEDINLSNPSIGN